MKRAFFFFAILFVVGFVFSQSPEGMSYQAVVRNSSNQLVTDQAVGMKISILQGSTSGTLVYSETHLTTTNANGVVTLKIGAGTVDSGRFDSIDWANGPYFVKTQTDPEGGTNYTIEGTSQFLSVPYAFHANTAQQVIEEKQDLASVVANHNWADGQIKNVSEPSEMLDAVNKAFVTLGLSSTGDTLYLGKQFVIIPGISTANISTPNVLTEMASNVLTTSATLEASIAANGWADVLECGFVYATTPEFSEEAGVKLISNTSESGYYAYELTELVPGETYYYKAFAKNKIGTAYGDEKSFTTSTVLMLMGSETAFMTGIDEVLGKGYDITTRYACSEVIKESVLDYESLFNAGKIHKDNNINEAHFSTISGKTSSDYQEDISQSANVSAEYAGFSGEMGYRFKSSNFSSEEYAFATRTSYIQKAAYYVERRNDPTSLIPYVSAQFLQDAATKTPEELFTIYGTDVMLGAKWGAKLDYNMTAVKKSNSAGSSISAYAEARYSSFTSGGSADVSVNNTYSSAFETARTEITTNAYGGDAQYAQYVHDANDYSQWIGSINQTNLVFMDYYDSGLKPISDFISDSTLKKKISDARNEYLKGKRIIVSISTKPMITNSPFIATGFTRQIGGGDRDVNSKSGRKTSVELSVTITKKDEANLNAKIFLKVTEVASNNTSLQGETNVTIPVNKEIKSIDINPASFTYSKIIYDKHHEWYSLGAPCAWLGTIYVKIDADASDDTKYVGIQGTFKVPITVRE